MPAAIAFKKHPILKQKKKGVVYLSVKEVAAIHKIADVSVNKWFHGGFYEGAVDDGTHLYIPEKEAHKRPKNPDWYKKNQKKGKKKGKGK